ncbi:methyltransferase domain-containing protein [Aliigemmobacter aestuarii]|uniref:Methyltransferase domain-containing protein n=1 Tax=Aliigemmobacter aestuarii TaxID=1445661 RepID=A0A4V6RS20_9RHOB|nr:transcription antitermination factor NusB [Gemmobacter aestuarii]THD83652.1 methyltransferase domain-containing protein [Gemmobacter aestuarii]
MAGEGLAARRAALALLAGVLGEGRMIGPLSGAADGPLSALAPADRARAQRLALTVLRHLDAADRVLAPLLQRPPPLAARNILRLAVVELAEGAAAHGVVNDAVTLARQGKRTASMAGMVNAVLRRLAQASVNLDAMPPQRMPDWLRKPLVAAWGPQAVAGMERVQSRAPVIDLTLRPGATVDPAPAGAERLPTGSLRLPPGAQVTALPGYDEGAFWVQDAAAALAVPLLAPQPGERVLDLCAAPGGKTLQLAAAGAGVKALDVSEPRLARLRENLARTGLEAQVVVADALEWVPDAPFDAILLDAPCSATGTIRRHPDLPFVKDRGDLAALTALQAALIDRALGWLAPGGRLVYCTCSLLPEEGEAQLDAALSRHPGLTVRRPDLPGVDPRWITRAGGLRLRPDYWERTGGMDGFFMACMMVR